MKIIESQLQSKFSPVPDDGGEDRIVVTENYVAVIDGATSKTDAQYKKGDSLLTPGAMAADILAEAIPLLDPDFDGKQACQFLNKAILDAYERYNILEMVKFEPVERFSAVMALYNHKKRYLVMAGECQAVIGYQHLQHSKKLDDLNSLARAQELTRLMESGELTEEGLMAMDINQDPGRAYIMNPGKNFPGLKAQFRYQNNPDSPYGYFAMDGFCNFAAPGFSVTNIPSDVSQLILATDGYHRPQSMDPADVMHSLSSAERYLNMILINDPCCYKIYKGIKGKGIYHSFDDRAYIRLAI